MLSTLRRSLVKDLPFPERVSLQDLPPPRFSQRQHLKAAAMQICRRNVSPESVFINTVEQCSCALAAHKHSGGGRMCLASFLIPELIGERNYLKSAWGWILRYRRAYNLKRDTLLACSYVSDEAQWLECHNWPFWPQLGIWTQGQKRQCSLHNAHFIAQNHFWRFFH